MQPRPSSAPYHPANVKVGRSLLDGPEQVFIRWAVPRMPWWITPDGLTFSSVPISAGIVACGYAARGGERWPVGAMALLVIAHWFVDSIDGALGRHRNTGMIRWGYYVDHLFDFFFLAAIFAAYGAMVDSWVTPWIMVVMAGHMISGYLVMGAVQRFQISHYGVGPTEGRLIVVGVNAGLAVFGVGTLTLILPAMLALSVVTLLAVVYREQRELRRLDLEARRQRDPVREAAESLFLH